MTGQEVKRRGQIEFSFLSRILETDAEIEARIAKWDKYLDNEDEDKQQNAAKVGKLKEQQKPKERPAVPEKTEVPGTAVKKSKKTEVPEEMNIMARVKAHEKALEAAEETDSSSNSEDSDGDI